MKIALAQLNPTVGDVEGNKQMVLAALNESDADLVVFPELMLTGYPPKDLLMKQSFVKANKEALLEIVAVCDKSCVIGFVDYEEGKLYNAAAVISNGVLVGIYHKQSLPNYDVFDEKRYFTAGTDRGVFEINGKKIGVTICEDVWVDGPVEKISSSVDFVVNISASPFYAGKMKEREEILSARARKNNVAIVYCNLVGGQDDLLFAGRSYIFNGAGQIICKGNVFKSEVVVGSLTDAVVVNDENVIGDIYAGLVLGIRDYFHKNGFSKAVLGLSGGIDSALTAALAVEALGKENVVGVSMPSKFSSSGSVDDSRILADNLEMEFHVSAIKDIYDSYLSTMEPFFRGTSFNVAEENIQARIRGNKLMALSNKFGYLVLATGNKSELSVGYATLYGDMAGGLAVISDLLKGRVYELCRYINLIKGREVIPLSIIDKEPSAELRDGQLDSDSLPDYPILDGILQLYVELDKSKEEIIAAGFSSDVVDRVINMVDRNEYKRQQAAIGIKITPRAFGSGRRMPIVNKWRG